MWARVGRGSSGHGDGRETSEGGTRAAGSLREWQAWRTGLPLDEGEVIDANAR